MAKRKDSPGQNHFDYSYATRRAIFRQMRLPATVVRESRGARPRGVSPSNMYLVLIVIDDHGQGCWPSIQTIADESKLSRKAVALALKGLQKLDLLCVDDRFKEDGSRTSNGYTIPWSRLEALCPPVPRGIGGTSHGGLAPDPTGDQERPIERPIEPPPPTPKPVNQPSTSWKAAAAEFSKAGIGAAQVLVRKCKAAGVSPAEAVERCRSGQLVVQEHPGAFKSPVGALAYHVETGGWPLDGVDAMVRRPAPAGDHPEHQPAIDAMTDEERLAMLPAGMARDNYELFGRHVPEVAWLLRHAYHVRHGSAAATA